MYQEDKSIHGWKNTKSINGASIHLEAWKYIHETLIFLEINLNVNYGKFNKGQEHDLVIIGDHFYKSFIIFLH